MLLGVYSAGLGIPFILAAMFVKPILSWLAKFRKNLGAVEKAMGVLLVVTGILFITGGMQTMAWWMQKLFRALLMSAGILFNFGIIRFTSPRFWAIGGVQPISLIASSNRVSKLDITRFGP
jgi:predicted benzoate:H+ symporter BenE